MLAHGGTGGIDQDLRGEGRVVDLHVELKHLVVRLAADAFAHKVHAMSHIVQGIHALHLEDVCLVVGEIGVGLDFLGYLLQGSALLQFHIHHTAVYAFAHGDSHGQGIAHTFFRAHAHAMPHGAAGAEVGVGQSLRRKALHQGAHHTVGAWIPTGGYHAHGTALLGSLVQGAAEVHDEAMDVETVHGVDAKLQAFKGMLFNRAGGGGKDGNVHLVQLLNALYYLIVFYLPGAVFTSGTAHDTGNLHVGSTLQCFNGGFTNITVSYYCYSNFVHTLMFLMSFVK